jgi:peptide/nickel transport system substrate-binding protein
LGSPAEIRTADPAIEDEISPLQLFGLTNDGLVTLNHAGGPDGTQLVPDLALSVPAATQGGRTYRFRLRRGIRYSTGRALAPHDVRRSFERLFELGSSGRSLYDRIVGARECLGRPRCDLSRGIVTDQRNESVTFHLARPDPNFLRKLSEPYAFVIPSSTPSRAALRPLPATGPYRISRFTRGREIQLTRNPRFREWSSAAQPDGYPDRILWRTASDGARAVALVQAGKADLMTNIGGPPPAQRDLLTTRFPSRLRTNWAMGTDFFFLNTRVRPFDDVRVRRALNYAIDRERIATIFGGPSSARPTCQILPPQIPGFRRYCPYTRDPRHDGRWSAPDLSRAKRLVTASSTKGMTVKVWSTPTPTVARDEAVYVTTLLRRLGYHASVRLLPDEQFLRYTDDSRNHAQVISGGWGADYPSPAAFIGRLTCSSFIPNSTATFDSGEFCDHAVDRQIERAEALETTDRSRAADAWRRLDRKLTDLAIWLPTVTSSETDIVSRRVGNYLHNPFWGPLIDQLWVR